MAQLIINVPDQNAQELFDAFWELFGTHGTIDPESPPPSTPAEKAEFVRRRLIAYCKDNVQSYRVVVAERSERNRPPVPID